ncbi:MAG: hypothetical protein HC933_21010 [Pleurocapsa sp. SU_196_0]|nr:hypothetical protein [Pleurocapsa sp. SU_196_0]
MGSDELGQLGNGGSNINRFAPTPVPRVSRVNAIAGGAFHSLAVLNDGTVLSWGSNLQGNSGCPGSRFHSRVPSLEPCTTFPARCPSRLG